MADQRKFFDKLRVSQVALARTLAAEIAEFSKAIVMLWNVVETAHNSGEVDRSAVQDALQGDLVREANLAVQGYTDWLACRVVQSASTEPRRLEMPSDGELDKIVAVYGTDKQLLRQVIRLMHEQSQLPLLGRIKEGALYPNVRSLSTWSRSFDWSGNGTPEARA